MYIICNHRSNTVNICSTFVLLLFNHRVCLMHLVIFHLHKQKINIIIHCLTMSVLLSRLCMGFSVSYSVSPVVSCCLTEHEWRFASLSGPCSTLATQFTLINSNSLPTSNRLWGRGKWMNVFLVVCFCVEWSSPYNACLHILLNSFRIF